MLLLKLDIINNFNLAFYKKVILQEIKYIFLLSEALYW